MMLNERLFSQIKLMTFLSNLLISLLPVIMNLSIFSSSFGLFKAAYFLENSLPACTVDPRCAINDLTLPLDS